MKNKFTLCVTILLFLSAKTFAQGQKLKWAVKDTTPSGSYFEKMICDKDSNVYLYGHNYDTTGSYLEVFSPAGNMFLLKKWNGKFNIQTMVYDGNQTFYFVGHFNGSLTVDRIPISSRGGMDGIFGQMTTGGTILWMQTFGSSLEEQGNGICFGPSNNSIVITGYTTDSLYVGNMYVAHNTQSALVAQFSLTGSLQNYKLHDFLPQRDNVFNGAPGLTNMGHEILAGVGGNYFLLTDREGKHPMCCTYDTLNAPEEGTYVMKLNANFDTLWTTYIISGECYYGYDYGHLAVSAAGDPYMPSNCGSHYGGDGRLQRLDQNTGAETWSEHHQDGGFQDVCLEGNTLYTCGTDSADYCPCQNNTPGYQDVKTFDQANMMTGILKFDQTMYDTNQPRLLHIIRDNFGSTYVQGEFSRAFIIFGKDTIKGDATAFSTWYGKFLLKISDTTFTTSIVKKVSAPGLNVYPNPSSSGSFEVSIGTKANGAANLNVRDCIGNLVYTEIFTCAQNETRRTIDLSKQAKGLYLVELYIGSEKYYRKVIVE